MFIFSVKYINFLLFNLNAVGSKIKGEGKNI